MAAKPTEFSKSSIYQTKSKNVEQRSLWQLKPTKGSTLSRNTVTRQRGSDSGLSEEDLLLPNRLKEELVDIVYKEEISGNKNLDFSGSNM